METKVKGKMARLLQFVKSGKARNLIGGNFRPKFLLGLAEFEKFCKNFRRAK